MTHELFWTIALSLLLSQGAKILIYIFKHGEQFHWKDLIVTGGMPSSHSAVVTGLTLALYMYSGLSPLFYLSLVFSLIVLRDAMGVRRTAGEEGKVLNQLIKKTKVHIPEMHYALGHTPMEVNVGMLIGIISAFAVYMSV